ncbi:hypothetical protein Lal_00016531 [Lupinus albus]|uniref:Uncharacterized protein n=1 Tax=Lupinus albus TaxID=3870 RepID=A0A6A5MDJ8_LUPAL|nr:hypothetical protein Lalb_Chr05g0223301 [Lupinus albus]KAF1872694.1 hypothetical protein Lal_00016531 [Lupinus albus]
MNVREAMSANDARNKSWDVKENFDDDISDSKSFGSISEDSINSACSSSSSELVEDASSSTSYLSTSSSSSQSNGPLYELSELMNNLPFKRGLSMFYQGKAQSFTSLARVQSIEDLPKKEKPYRKKMKSCKSFRVDLDSHRILYSPKATISKKNSRESSFASLITKRGDFLRGSRSSSISVQKDF